MAEEFDVPFLGSVPMDVQFLALIEEGKRPTYPSGTQINGKDISSPQTQTQTQGNEAVASGESRSEGSLVDKYRDCSLYHVFGGITDSVKDRVLRNGQT